jgi:transposase
METISEMTVLDRALAVGDAGRMTGGRQERPDPEVPEKARRRTFTAQDKLDVVGEYDAAATGEKGAVLRREGLYSSHIVEWRRARDAVPWRAKPGHAAARRLTRGMRRSPGCRKSRPSWERELAKARFVVDVQSKLQALLETISEGADSEPGSSS